MSNALCISFLPRWTDSLRELQSYTKNLPIDLHLTLYYAGNMEKVSFEEARRITEAMKEVCQIAAHKYVSLQGYMTDLGSFPPNEFNQQRTVYWVQPDVPYLYNVREDIAKKMVARKVPPQGATANMPWKSHMTVGYVSPEEEESFQKDRIIELLPFPILFDAIKVNSPLGDNTYQLRRNFFDLP